MSLYANLLETASDSSASISREPVLFKQDESGDNGSKKAIDSGTQEIRPLVHVAA